MGEMGEEEEDGEDDRGLLWRQLGDKTNLKKIPEEENLGGRRRRFPNRDE